MALETTASLDGEDYVLNGEKKGIGNGSVGDSRLSGHAITTATSVVPRGTGPGRLRGRDNHRKGLTAGNTPGPNQAEQRPRSKTNLLPGAALQGHVRSPCCHPAGGRLVRPRPPPPPSTKPRSTMPRNGHGSTTRWQSSNCPGATGEMLSELTSMQLHCSISRGLMSAGEMRPTQAPIAEYHDARKATSWHPFPATCSAATASCSKTT